MNKSLPDIRQLVRLRQHRKMTEDKDYTVEVRLKKQEIRPMYFVIHILEDSS